MSLPLLHAGRTNPGLSPQLDLRFALDKSLTAYRGPTPSFSRASTGSYFDGSGVLRYAALNQVLYSEDFGNAAWAKQNGTISTDQIIAPDGKTTADKFTENVANTFFNIYNSSAVSHSAGATMTASGYFKYGTRRYIQFILGPAAAGVSVVVDLLNGLITATGSSGAASYTSSSITNAGNGWYRVSVTGTLPSANTGYYDLFTSNTSSFVNPYPTFSSSGEYTYIWGAQVETGSTVGTYCPTTSSANSAPRFDHTFNGTSWVSRGLLVEEQRTNSISYSNSFATGFTIGSAQLTSGAANSPDGTANGWKLYESASGSGSLDQRRYGNYTITGQNTISIYAKAAERRRILLFANGPNQGAWFDLVSGTAGNDSTWTGATQSIQNVGNGWYRCVMTTGVQATTIQIQILLDGQTTNGGNRVGDGVSGVYIAHIQGESGAFATSMIPTNGSTATRSADVCQITGSDFSSFWNASEGSLAAELDLAAPVTGITYYPFYFGASDSATNTKRLFYFSDIPTGTSSLYVSDGTTTSKLTTSTIPGNSTTFKAAMCYKTDDLAISLNGASVVTDLSQPIPTGLDRLQIGSNPSANNFNGHIARLRYYRKRLPNATLQQLSEPDPTLNLQFALNKTLTPVAGPAPSFSRASTGTYFNSSGVLTSAAINAPRFDHTYDGTSWISKGLLIEEQRTNLVQYSEQFNTSPWAVLNASISANAASSPDGNTTADKLVESATGPNAHEVFVAFTASTATYTFSIFAKAAERSSIYLSLGSSISSGVYFNLSNGTVGAASGGLTGSIQNVGNGWYRCSVVGSLSSGTNYIQIATSDGTNYDYTGNGTSGLLLFGAQLELGAFPTSYIPTTTTSVVRSADVCQITGTSFGSMWNQGEGSVVAEWDARRNSGGQFTVYWARDAASSNTVLHTGREALSPPGVRFTAVSGASVSAEIINAGFPDPGVQTKTAGCYKVNDFAYAYNGNLVGTDTSGAVPVNPTDILIGSDPYSNCLNGHIAKLIYYPARLTNTKLQQLST